MAELGFDVSTYQPSNIGYFQKLKSAGAKFVFIKLTEGTYFTSSVASSQIYSANHANIPIIGAYHFFHGNGKAEARYFLARVKEAGLDKSTPLALDAEASDAGYDSNFNAFLDECWNYGYHNLFIYSMASWFGTRIHPSNLHHGHLWVANINGYIGVDNATIWQYTWTYGGENLDANKCYFPERLGSARPAVESTTAKIGSETYYKSGSLFEVIAPNGINCYTDGALSKPNGSIRKRQKGYQIHASVDKVGNYYRLKTKYGNYYTANTKYVRRVK